LKSIARDAPESLEKLRSIRGFGAKKVAKYGSDIIGLVKDFFGQT